MPWQNNGGPWGGGGRGPWGQGPRGPGQSPDLEELLRKGQDRFKGLMPKGGWGKGGIILAVLLVAAVWLASGFYRVEPDEQGVVLRFGKWVATTQPGLNYHLPAPIESVETPQVTRVNRVDIGFQAGETLRTVSTTRDVPNESLMLTGDENIVDIDFAVFWVIKDAGQFLFNIRNPEGEPGATVKAVAESVMREVIGRTPIQVAQTEGRATIAAEAQKQIQSVLDYYQAGIQITQVQLMKVDPPAAVIDSYRDVQAARADLERQRNEAQAYANDVVPRARGDAERILQEAQAYKQQVVADAEGQAARFLSVLKAYNQAKDITTQRIYIETMETILKDMNKVVMDDRAGDGVVPYLPLPALRNSTVGDSSSNQGGIQ